MFKGHSGKKLWKTYLKYYTFLIRSIVIYYFLLIYGYFYIKVLGVYCEKHKIYN